MQFCWHLHISNALSMDIMELNDEPGIIDSRQNHHTCDWLYCAKMYSLSVQIWLKNPWTSIKKYYFPLKSLLNLWKRFLRKGKVLSILKLKNVWKLLHYNGQLLSNILSWDDHAVHFLCKVSISLEQCISWLWIYVTYL